MGHAHLAGKTVRDDQGQPVLMADKPLVSADERELIASALHRAEGAPRERRAPAMLGDISRCWFCEGAMTTNRQTKALASGVSREYGYYRCPNGCGPMVPMDTADAEFERALLSSLGDEEMTERVWVPGDSNESDLRAAVSAMEELSEAAGRATSQAGREVLQRQLAALDARVAELEVLPSREGGYENHPTGETYRQAWDRTADETEARRDLLRRVGVDFRIGVHEGTLLSHVVALGDRLTT